MWNGRNKCKEAFNLFRNENTSREIFTPMDKDWGLNRDEVQEKLQDGKDKIKDWWQGKTNREKDMIREENARSRVREGMGKMLTKKSQHEQREIEQKLREKANKVSKWEPQGAKWEVNDDEKWDWGDKDSKSTARQNAQWWKIKNAQTGEATSTRYWDCNGGTCGCGSGKVSNPASCYSNAMFRAPVQNSFGATFYGTAAVSAALGGATWNGPGCGKCWRVQAQSNIGGKTQSSTLVLKATNYCGPDNKQCESGAHFKIAAVGFDDVEASQWNNC